MSSPGIFEVWNPSHQLRAAFSLNLPLDFLKMVECELQNTLLRFEAFYNPFATNWRPNIGQSWARAQARARPKRKSWLASCTYA